MVLAFYFCSFLESIFQVTLLVSLKRFKLTAKQGKFNPERFNNFIKLVNKIIDSNVKLILYIPPNYPEVNDLIDIPDTSLTNRVRKELKVLFPFIYDYHDPSVIDSGPCEFLDSWHGGEITYLRILKDIAKTEPSLAKFLDLQNINHLIDSNKGQAEIMRSGYPIKNEIDYLKIGCLK